VLAAAFAFNVSLFVARPLLRQGLGVFGEPNVSLSELEEFETLGGVGCPPDGSQALTRPASKVCRQVFRHRQPSPRQEMIAAMGNEVGSLSDIVLWTYTTIHCGVASWPRASIFVSTLLFCRNQACPIGVARRQKGSCLMSDLERWRDRAVEVLTEAANTRDEVARWQLV